MNLLLATITREISPFSVARLSDSEVKRQKEDYFNEFLLATIITVNTLK